MSTLIAPNSTNKEIQPVALYAMPATPLQVRLFALEQSARPDPAWNVAVRFRLVGPLNREKLESALQWLVRRHEALRTSLAFQGETVVQEVADRRSFPVEWCDLRDLQDDAQAVETIRLSLEHARQILPLGAAPLFRARLLRLKDDEHLMLWNAHHAICDGWSVGLLTRDLMESYEAVLQGREPKGKDSLDFGDYAVWLDEQRRTPEYAAHRSYWQRRLGGHLPSELPSAWRNSDPGPVAPSIHSRLLPRAITDRLAAVAQGHDSTFFHAALAAFALLLRSQQGTAEVAIGSPLSGREQPDVETIVGSFVNYVPLHFAVAPEQRYIDLLRSVRELLTDSLDHSQFRFEDMMADLASSGAPNVEADRLFSAIFICQQDFVRPIVVDGLSLSAVPSVSPGALHPLTVFMVERLDGWRLSCEVDNRTVSSAAGLGLIENLERLIAVVAEHPEESAALLVARVGLPLSLAAGPTPSTQTDFSGADARPSTLEIERQPVRIPATEFQRRFWQLDAINPGGAAFHIRIRLELLGQLDVNALRTAVESLARRHEILRTTLEDKDGQIWQQIHSELPIDFRFLSSSSAAPIPETRLAGEEAILENEGRARFSLTSGPLFRVRVLQVENQRHWLAITLSHGVVDGWSAGLFLEQLQHAYEQHAAGTGGNPQLPTLQFAEYADSERRLLASPKKDRRLDWWKQYLDGIWKPLALPRDLDGSLAGQSEIPAGLQVTQLAPESIHLARRFARECQTTLFAVFGALFQALLFRLSGQRDMLFLTPHANRSGDTETIMGPLADPICLTGHIGDRTTLRELVTRFSTQAMDAMENALPLNVVTPLVDMRVAGGYHPLNQITFVYQRAFVHDMEWKGLRVQSLPDAPSVAAGEWQLGIVERGAGISLEFVYDATLYSQSRIQAASQSLLRLLSQSVAEPEKAVRDLDFLMPERVGSSKLPALGAGSSIPPPARPPALPIEQAAAFIVPENGATTGPQQTQAESDILRIWRQLFKVEELDLDSNFFDLGGHSLLLARLQIALKKEFRVQLTAAEVFRQPTVASLAAWLEKAQTAARLQETKTSAPYDPRIVPIQPSGAGRPIFVISQSMIFRTLAAELGPEQPVYTIQMLDEDTLAMGSPSFEDLIQFYVRLIRQVQPAGPYRLAGWCVSGWIAYGVARHLEKQGSAIEMLMIIDAWAPGYWAGQPPVRRHLMGLVYEMKRSRWIGRRLRNAAAEDPEHSRRGMMTRLLMAARNKIVRFGQRGVADEANETEDQRRLTELQRTANSAGLMGPLVGNIILFRSEEESTGPLLARDMGWGKVVGRDIVVNVLPGGHHQIFDPPGARMMAAHAREVLGTLAARPPAAGAVANGASAKSSARSSPLVEA